MSVQIRNDGLEARRESMGGDVRQLLRCRRALGSRQLSNVTHKPRDIQHSHSYCYPRRLFHLAFASERQTWPVIAVVKALKSLGTSAHHLPSHPPGRESSKEKQ